MPAGTTVTQVTLGKEMEKEQVITVKNTELFLTLPQKRKFCSFTQLLFHLLLPFKHPWRYMNLPRDGTLLKSKRLETLGTTRKFAPK